MNLLVPPLTAWLSLRTALLLCFPFLYLVGAVLFILALVLVTCCARARQGTRHDVEIEEKGETEEIDVAAECKALEADLGTGDKLVEKEELSYC